MHSLIQPIIDDLSTVIFGKQLQIKLALSCLFSQGHLLIEDLPGMGKTTLSHALSAVLGLSYQRVQFTSDLLPSDIIGTTVFDPNKHEFNFHKGPIFSQVVLADEINRAGPKTQSALLEAMEEQQVTVDGTKYKLPQPFFVIATQNPANQSGTYPLPESQLDRFFMRISLGFPEKQAERKLILGSNNRNYDDLPVRINPEQLIAIQKQVEQVKVAAIVVDYILDLVSYTREQKQYANPLSPRASIALAKAAKAWAFIDGRDYVTADDVKAIFNSVTDHRLGITNNAQASAINHVAVPI